jgi:hypothetical protein
LNDYFASRRIRVILDNVEQVSEAANFFDRLVAGSLGLVMLVTSRERLALAREHVSNVGAMAAPGPAGDLNSETGAPERGGRALRAAGDGCAGDVCPHEGERRYGVSL